MKFTAYFKYWTSLYLLSDSFFKNVVNVSSLSAFNKRLNSLQEEQIVSLDLPKNSLFFKVA